MLFADAENALSAVEDLRHTSGSMRSRTWSLRKTAGQAFDRNKILAGCSEPVKSVPFLTAQLEKIVDGLNVLCRICLIANFLRPM